MTLTSANSSLSNIQPNAELLGTANPAAVYLARLAPRSRPVQRSSLDAMARLVSSGRHDAETLPWHSLRYAHTQAVRAELAARYAPATANRMLAALRGTLKECWRLGLIPAEDYHRAADVMRVRGKRLRRGRRLASAELAALFAACAADVTVAGRRDAALLAILYSAGLRRAEAAALAAADYQHETRAITVRHGKGDKSRRTYMPPSAARPIAEWLAARGDWPGPLLCSTHWGGSVLRRGMTTEAIRLALKRRARQAGVKEFAPHDLRRSFCSDALESGADLSTVQQMMGHSDPGTTAGYDERGEAAKRKAADLLHVPFGD